MVEDTEKKALSDQLIIIPNRLLSVTPNSASLLAASSSDKPDTCTGGCQGSGCQSSCEDSCQSQAPTNNPPTDSGDITVLSQGYNSNGTITVRVRLSSIPGATRYTVAYRVDGAPSSSTVYVTATSLTCNITGLSPFTDYIINYRGENSNGSGPFMSPGISVLTRPANWDWWSTVSSRFPIKLSANEWNAFCERINEFREYKGLSQYSFTEVSRGDRISATIVNQAVRAVQSMKPISVPNSVRSGDPLAASFFIGLKNSLNSIL